MVFCFMMRDVPFLAAASSALRTVLAAPARQAECLGVTRGALYLKTAGPPGVLVVLSHDAVRLPCGLVLPSTSAELPLTSLAPARSWRILIGNGEVRWAGPDGPVVVRAVREWAPARLARGQVAARALAEVRSALNRADPGIDGGLLVDLGAAAGDHKAATAVATRLLGSGPGLTPSGDDVLAGFLAGAAAFGVAAAPLRGTVAVLAPARTTALSAALLWHAARGECIGGLAGLAAVLTSQRPGGPELAGPAVRSLLSVGHTSGAALALGLVTAAESALRGTVTTPESSASSTSGTTAACGGSRQ